MQLILGNTAVATVVKQADPDDEEREVEVRTSMPELGNQLTIVDPPDGTPDDEVLAAVRSLWPYHSDADGPEWVECDDAHIAESVARMFTTEEHTCAVGRPDDWQEG